MNTKRIGTLQELLPLARGNKKVVAIAAAEDDTVLKAAQKAYEHGIADFILFGDPEKIRSIAQDEGIDVSSFQIVSAFRPEEAGYMAVKSVFEQTAHTVMKGNIKTADLLKTILKDEFGLKTDRTMSLVAVFEIPDFERLLVITDPGIVIQPTLEQKVHLLQNACAVAKVLGIEEPKAGIIGAVEVVNPKMPATMEAAVLSKMAERGQIGKLIVDGPFALDNVVSEEACRHKGIVSPVGGKADIILTPDLNAGNILYKALVFLAKAKLATTIMGAKVPIILTSRADSDETKLYSIALNILLSEVLR
ncbi:MAG: bifunctional enoyl-CoA hydratase/phosphate acetyltransferase [Thermotogae bacterium]|nr:bifunctional enoyl-CoA hydratase/phosphate acetyltransferase [Thermotogota bacterium]